MAESIYQESMGVTGLPGVQTSTRLVGTVSGSAPSTGTFSTSDFVVDQTGGFWVCSSGGTPGNWTRVNSNASVASVNLTAQTAAISPTTLYTTTTSGLFNISYYAKVTTPAGSSSNLGPFNVISTDPDGNAVTTVGFTSSQNSSVSGFISGNATVYVGSGTNIQYSLGYTSSGSPSMAYSLHAIVSSSVIAPSINAVNSFNGRTGTVVAASGDYTAAQGVLQTTTNVAGKNFVINGAMDFWQRGTSFTNPAYPNYFADRWQAFETVVGVLSQDTTLVPSGSKYGLRFTAAGASWQGNIYQVIETSNTLPLAGQTVTLSFQVAGSGTNATIYPSINYSTAVDASLSTGTWVNISPTSYTNVPTPTSTFQTGLWTGTIPSNAKTIYVQIGNFNAIPSGSYYTVGNVQLEIGSTATTFTRAGGTIQGELSACQRYYWQSSGGAGVLLATGFATNSGNAGFMVPHPVTMRIYPTPVAGVGQQWTYDGVTTNPVTYIGLGGGLAPTPQLGWVVTSGSYTQFRPYFLYSISSSGYIGFNAEL